MKSHPVHSATAQLPAFSLAQLQACPHKDLRRINLAVPARKIAGIRPVPDTRFNPLFTLILTQILTDIR
jgi:hypothetical protein